MRSNLRIYENICNMFWLITFIALSMLVVCSIQISTPESLTYVAGVVEYHVNQGSSSISDIEKFQRNADKYIEIMYSPEASNVDIIVFPESCLNSPSVAVDVPNEMDDIDICTNNLYEQNLRNIACAARDLRKYVVINLTMKRNCTEEIKNACADEWVLYNTNVVFDRDGKVISIYRKYNLFGEKGISKPSSPDISKFSTDFGVTFGHFTCFDLQFQSPALDLIDQGIRDIIFPTMWFSELPFLTAVQLQQNWAHVNDVNFLGAGANNPKDSSTGSGIYSGKLGALVSIMTGEETTRLLVHEVPKIPGTSITKSSPAYSGTHFDQLDLWRDQLDVYTRKEIELPVSTSTLLHQSFTLCHTFKEEFCCDFKIDVALQAVAENSVSYTYYAVVFSGIRSFSGLANGGIQTCGVIACRNNDISTCGTMYPPSEIVESKINFLNIVIEGDFPMEFALTMPNSLNFNVSPYPTTDFSFTEPTNIALSMINNEATKNVTISLLTPKTDLLTFAIYSRDFRFTSSGKKITSTMSILLMVFLFIY